MSLVDTRQRLRQANARLEFLKVERQWRCDPSFGKAEEQAVIFRELIELELQAIDEEIDRIYHSTAERPLLGTHNRS